MKKAEVRLLQLLVFFSFSIFIYFMFDLCSSYINVYDAMLGQCKSVPVISLIPML